MQIDFVDPSRLPHIRHDHHPVDDIEPVDHWEHRHGQHAEEFGRCLVYLASGFPSVILMSSMAIKLACEVIDRPHNEKVAEFTKCRKTLNSLCWSYGVVFDWLIRGRDRKEIGMRTIIILYCVRPDLIGGITLDQIGSRTNISRQAVDKLVINFSETFKCFKGQHMKKNR